MSVGQLLMKTGVSSKSSRDRSSVMSLYVFDKLFHLTLTMYTQIIKQLPMTKTHDVK